MLLFCQETAGLYCFNSAGYPNLNGLARYRSHLTAASKDPEPYKTSIKIGCAPAEKALAEPFPYGYSIWSKINRNI